MARLIQPTIFADSSLHSSAISSSHSSDLYTSLVSSPDDGADEEYSTMGDSTCQSSHCQICLCSHGLSCDFCLGWFHGNCVNVNLNSTVDMVKYKQPYRCPTCSLSRPVSPGSICPLCFKGFANPNTLWSHINRIHSAQSIFLFRHTQPVATTMA